MEALGLLPRALERACRVLFLRASDNSNAAVAVEGRGTLQPPSPVTPTDSNSIVELRRTLVRWWCTHTPQSRIQYDGKDAGQHALDGCTLWPRAHLALAAHKDPPTNVGHQLGGGDALSRRSVGRIRLLARADHPRHAHLMVPSFRIIRGVIPPFNLFLMFSTARIRNPTNQKPFTTTLHIKNV